MADEEKKQKNKTRWWFVTGIVLLTLLAFFAGIVGELVTRYYLSNFSVFSDLYVGGSDGRFSQGDVVIQAPKKVVVEEDVRLDQLHNDTRSAVVSIFKKKSATTLPEELYLPTDLVGSGVFLTSDGWIVTSASANPSTQVVVDSLSREYVIEDVVVDKGVGLSFIKITYNGAPVLELGDVSLLGYYQKVAVLDSFNNRIYSSNIIPDSLGEISSVFDFVQSSESLNERMILADSFGDGVLGGPVLGLGGDIVGIISSDNNGTMDVTPVDYIQSSLSAILKGEDIVQTYLGVNYISLSNVSGVPQELSNQRKFGALITKNAQGVAVVTGSPASDIFKEGDLLIAVEGKDIDKRTDLHELIREFSPGNEIRITYIRGGEQKEAVVVLGSK